MSNRAFFFVFSTSEANFTEGINSFEDHEEPQLENKLKAFAIFS